MANSSLNSVKRIVYYDEKKNVSTEIVIEEVLDAAYGCYIWPSALVMGEFVWHDRDRFAGATVLEVGAGTSIPSLVLAKSASVSHLLLTDIPAILPVIKGCLDLNQIQSDVVSVRALEWGTGTSTSIDTWIDELPSQLDYIIGSDTFYEPSQFENLLVLVSFVIHNHNPNCKFFTTYQERSPKRSIQYLLDKWGLQCRFIPKETFQFDELKYIDEEEEEDSKIKSEVRVNAGTLSSVFLLEITRAS